VGEAFCKATFPSSSPLTPATQSVSRPLIRRSRMLRRSALCTIAEDANFLLRTCPPTAMRCWIAALELKLPCAERLIQSPHRAFGCFSLLILNDWAAPSYQLLDLSLAGLPLDKLLSFEVGVLVLSFLDNCLPRINASHFSPAALIYFPTIFRSASLILSCQPGPAS
jgi:hypothetical protein